MCTLAWGKSSGRLWVCFNRDEKHSRPEAESPQLQGNPGVRLAFARDPVGGGSWCVASECGFVVALLNNYPIEPGQGKFKLQSRGQLVLKAAQQGTTTEAEYVLRQMDLKQFAPFHIFVLSIDETFAHTWDGKALKALACPRQFWTTSSHLQKTVVQWRKNWWIQQTAGSALNVDSAGKIMQKGNLLKPAYGTAMDREDARTVSQIQVQMDVSGFTFEYLVRDKLGNGFLPPKTLHCSA